MAKKIVPPIPAKAAKSEQVSIPSPEPVPIKGAPPAFAARITPDMAIRWLEKNKLNRIISQSSVDTWAYAMKSGQWELNGHTIIISDEGDVLDGQHRLNACFISNTAFDSYVIIGMTKEVFATLDQGKKRSGFDALHIFNKMNNIEGKFEHHVTAAAVTCIEYRDGSWKSRHTHAITNSDKIKFIQDNPGLVQWVTKARVKKKDWVNRHSPTIGAVAYLGSKKYPMKAETFVTGFLTGDALADDSPIRELRRRLSSETKFIKWDRMKLIIYAWNLHIENIGKHTLRMPLEVPIIAGAEAPARLKKAAEDAKKPKKRITVSVKGTQTSRRL
jgi:hypothetical protein